MPGLPPLQRTFPPSLAPTPFPIGTATSAMACCTWCSSKSAAGCSTFASCCAWPTWGWSPAAAGRGTTCTSSPPSRYAWSPWVGRASGTWTGSWCPAPPWWPRCIEASSTCLLGAQKFDPGGGVVPSGGGAGNPCSLHVPARSKATQRASLPENAPPTQPHRSQWGASPKPEGMAVWPRRAVRASLRPGFAPPPWSPPALGPLPKRLTFGPDPCHAHSPSPSPTLGDAFT